MGINELFVSSNLHGTSSIEWEFLPTFFFDERFVFGNHSKSYFLFQRPYMIYGLDSVSERKYFMTSSERDVAKILEIVPLYLVFLALSGLLLYFVVVKKIARGRRRLTKVKRRMLPL